MKILVAIPPGVKNPTEVKRLKSLGITVVNVPKDRPIALAFNQLIEHETPQYFTYLPQGVTFHPDTFDKWIAEMEANPKIGFIYSDYIERIDDTQNTVKLRDYDGDWTERFEFGPVKFYRTAAIREVGSYNTQLKYAYEYDLHLRLSEHYQIHHHPTPCYDLTLTKDKLEDRQFASNKLFFPGSSKYGGFAYLFYSRDEELEIEHAFEQMLKRRGIYIELPWNRVPQVETKPGDPIVSIITPVYNRERFISNAIESVLQQTLKAWEYIIVDNGSTDRTKDIIREYMRKEPRIRLIENNINIIGYSLTLGLQHARGKYVAQLDSDDEYLPETLECMVEALETHPFWGVAISYYELMDEAGNPIPEMGVIKHLEYNQNNILRVDGAGAVRVWHRSVIHEFGGFDYKTFGDYGEDYDLILKVSEKYQIGRVHKVLYRYRRHPDNTDVKRPETLKLRNKRLARELAATRRRRLNERTAA